MGDYELPYRTSSMEQSSQILENGTKAYHPQSRMELQKSHFTLGNFDPNYNTEHIRQYYDKSASSQLENPDYKRIERGLRAHNYVLGDDKPDYVSETAAKFTAPEVKPEDFGNKQKISTAELQQSHYVFGTFNQPMITTQRRDYQPKSVPQKLYTKNLTKTNFILGDEEPTLKSVNQETYIKHPTVYNPINQELANDLRRHHFEFGNADFPSQLVTANNRDYPAYTMNPEDKPQQTISNAKLRESHWSLGNPGEESKDHYTSTYAMDMVPKTADPAKQRPNTTFKSSFSINGNGPTTYATEFRSNYIPMNNKIDPNQMKVMKDLVKNIKGSHFDLGDMGNDYTTTHMNAYKFDPEAAKDAKGNLDRALLNDLRSTHYKLGYMPIEGQTTYRSHYIPLENAQRAAKDPHLQDNHFSLGPAGQANPFEGITIYMSDYIPKPLPKDDD
ncbi:MAG: hypothetical protein MJ252_00495 [archaeon]|nr:hypothetical protein [archaeon]